MVTEEALNARCAFHQNQPASFTCERCGNFGCELCRGLSKGPRCAACFARGKEEVRQVVAPAQAEFHELLRESLRRPWSKKGTVLAIAFVQAIPAAVTSLVVQQALTSLGPEFQVGSLAAPPATPPDLDQLIAAMEPYTAQLGIAMLLSALLGNAAMSFCTALFAARPPAGGIGATALRRFPWVVVANLFVGMILGAATLACCLPVIPASAATTVVLASVVLGGQNPWSAVSSSFRRVLPQLWVVVGVEVLLWSLVFGAGMMAGALQTPFELAFGTAGSFAIAAISAYVTAVLGTARLALGVVIFERAESATKR